MILRIRFLKEFMIKDKLKIPIFPLRAKPYIAVQSKKTWFYPFVSKKSIKKLWWMEKSKIILMARYKLMLTKACLVFDKKNWEKA